jgi:hypothetical protein
VGIGGWTIAPGAKNRDGDEKGKLTSETAHRGRAGEQKTNDGDSKVRGGVQAQYGEADDKTGQISDGVG